MNRPRPTQATRRPVLYQVCRASERFEVGDGPFDLRSLDRLVLGRGNEGGYDTRANEDIIRVPDPWMSSRHVSLNRDGNGFRIRDEGSTNGALVNGKRVADALLDNGDLIETGRTFWVYCLLPLEPALPVEPAVFGSLQTWNPALAQQFGALGKLSRTAQPMLLLGEPGTGKNFLARAVHEASQRAGRFVELDCGRIPPERAAQELFGAQDPRAGALHLSTAGTLFLQRVEALPLAVQDMLAQALETSRVTSAVGGRASTVELRLVAAAEVDVDAAVARGRFSSRLADRLSGGTVRLPPLRQRREDLGLLMESLLERADGARAITRDACRALLNYPWPRNTRELSKVLEGGAILATDEGALDLRHLPGVVAVRSGVGAPEVASGETPMVTGEYESVARQAHAESTEHGSDVSDEVPVVPPKRAAPPGPPPPPPPVRNPPPPSEDTSLGDEDDGVLQASDVDNMDAFESLSTDLPEPMMTDPDQAAPSGIRVREASRVAPLPAVAEPARAPSRPAAPAPASPLPRPSTRDVPGPSTRVAVPRGQAPSAPPARAPTPSPPAPAASAPPKGKVIRAKR